MAVPPSSTQHAIFRVIETSSDSRPALRLQLLSLWNTKADPQLQQLQQLLLHWCTLLAHAQVVERMSLPGATLPATYFMVSSSTYFFWAHVAHIHERVKRDTQWKGFRDALEYWLHLNHVMAMEPRMGGVRYTSLLAQHQAVTTAQEEARMFPTPDRLVEKTHDTATEWGRMDLYTKHLPRTLELHLVAMARFIHQNPTENEMCGYWVWVALAFAEVHEMNLLTIELQTCLVRMNYKHLFQLPSVTMMPFMRRSVLHHILTGYLTKSAWVVPFPSPLIGDAYLRDTQFVCPDLLVREAIVPGQSNLLSCMFYPLVQECITLESSTAVTEPQLEEESSPTTITIRCKGVYHTPSPPKRSLFPTEESNSKRHKRVNMEPPIDEEVEDMNILRGWKGFCLLRRLGRKWRNHRRLTKPIVIDDSDQEPSTSSTISVVEPYAKDYYHPPEQKEALLSKALYAFVRSRLYKESANKWIPLLERGSFTSDLNRAFQLRDGVLATLAMKYPGHLVLCRDRFYDVAMGAGENDLCRPRPLSEWHEMDQRLRQAGYITAKKRNPPSSHVVKEGSSPSDSSL